jgi:hypothetical protein
MESPQLMQLIMTDPNLFYSYVAAIKSVGFVSATGQIVADFERFIGPPPELACKGMGGSKTARRCSC